MKGIYWPITLRQLALDEITFPREWFRAIKLYIDTGKFKRDLAVAPKNIIALLDDFLGNPYHYIDFSKVSAKLGKEPAELLKDYVEGKFKVIIDTDQASREYYTQLKRL